MTTKDSSAQDERGAATLERALTILAAFELSPTLPLAEIARHTGLYKSTLLRLLSTLERFGYVGQQSDGSYHIGLAGLRLGNLYQRWVTPADVINPALQSLSAELRESCSFNVREGEVRVCVYRVDSTQKIRDHVRVGDILPLRRGAAGKVMMAFDAEPTANAWSAVRTECFVVTRGEIEPDTAAVAAPVFEAGGHCKGAVAVTGPAFRFTEERAEAMRVPLLRSATAMTAAFGGDARLLEEALRMASNPSAK